MPNFNPPFSFGNRSAIVTGGTGNIGFAIAEKLLQSGMKVSVFGKTPEKILIAQSKLQMYEDNVLFVECDMTNPEELSKGIDRVNYFFGSIDALVNCAGILETNNIEILSEYEWDLTLDVNLKAIFLMIQKTIPYLRNGTSPRIVNISSNAGRMGGYVNGPAYAASKGGVIALTYNLARQLSKFGITVNCVAPGTIESDMGDAIKQKSGKLLDDRFLMGRFGKATEVAAAVCYFLSLESDFTTGAVLDINGGLFMG